MAPFKSRSQAEPSKKAEGYEKTNSRMIRNLHSVIIRLFGSSHSAPLLGMTGDLRFNGWRRAKKLLPASPGLYHKDYLLRHRLMSYSSVWVSGFSLQVIVTNLPHCGHLTATVTFSFNCFEISKALRPQFGHFIFFIGSSFRFR